MSPSLGLLIVRVFEELSTNTSNVRLATTKVTSFSYDLAARTFTGTGGHVTAIPKDNSDIAYDFEFFLGRVDSLFLTSEGDFKIVSGNPAEETDAPKPV